MSLIGIPLDTMTEQELRTLKHDRGLAFYTLQVEHRKDALALQSRLDVLQKARHAEYIEIAANTPGSVSTQVG